MMGKEARRLISAFELIRPNASFMHVLTFFARNSPRRYGRLGLLEDGLTGWDGYIPSVAKLSAC